MQLSYNQETPRAIEGLAETAKNTRSYKNPLLAQAFTVLVGGTASDGDYTITLTDGDSGESVTVVVTRSTTPATNANIASALQEALDDLGAPWAQRFTATVNSATITIAFSDPQRGRTWAVTATAPGSGTMTVTETQGTGGASVPMGVWVKRATGTDDTMARLVSGDTVGALVGIVLRPVAFEVENLGNKSLSARDAWPAGSILPVMRGGTVWVRVETAVTPATTPHVRVNASAGEVSGAMRDDVDGGDAISAATKCRFLTTAAAGELALVEIFDAA